MPFHPAREIRHHDPRHHSAAGVEVQPQGAIADDEGGPFGQAGPGPAGGEVREDAGVELGEDGAGRGVGEEGGGGVEVVVPLVVGGGDAGGECGGGGDEGGGGEGGEVERGEEGASEMHARRGGTLGPGNDGDGGLGWSWKLDFAPGGAVL